VDTIFEDHQKSIKTVLSRRLRQNNACQVAGTLGGVQR